MKATMRAWMAAGVVCAAMGARAEGQSASQRNPSPPMSDPMSDPRIPSTNKATQEKMAISRNDERQKRLVADTNQLLDLAMKLKDEVDKTDKYTLSLDVVKRTAEIEKLAKSIRERMKD